MYQVQMRKQALKKLEKMPQKQRSLIATSIQVLGVNPDNSGLDVTKLESRPGYRMRVGNWRILYLRDDEVKILSIFKIGPRGDVYK